jgi:hypothetical protein
MEQMLAIYVVFLPTLIINYQTYVTQHTRFSF